MKNSKRILFITHDPFSSIGNNGKTFLSLFAEFHSSSIAQLFFNNLNPVTEKFNCFFRITELDILMRFFLFKKITGNVKNIVHKKATPHSRKQTILKSELIKLLRNFLFWIYPVENNKSLINWITNFNPDLIFFSASNYRFQFLLLSKLSKKYNLPYYIYFTDDYFIHNNGNNFILKYLHSRFLNKSKQVIQNSQELFVISPKMKLEYESFFNKKCTILINAVENVELNLPIQTLSKPIIFRYFGFLHSNRSSSLAYLGKCLKFIKDNYFIDCKLEIYKMSELSNSCKKKLDIETIDVFDPIIGEEYARKIESSDFLVHAESFKEKYTKITRLSISTKIPEYLLSNRCIIAIGPSELASIDIFSQNDLGIVFTNLNSVQEDSLKLMEVFYNIKQYNYFCQKSIDFCNINFNARKMKSYLKNTLNNSGNNANFVRN